MSICVTSTTDVLLPSVSDFILVLLHELADFTHTVRWKTVLHSQFNLRFQPELGVAVRAFDMHVHAFLFQ